MSDEKEQREDVKWLEEIPWQEFRDSGLLWFTNRILHFFGVAICFEFVSDEKGEPTDELNRVYVARCRFRGFDEKSEEQGFENLYRYMKTALPDISKDVDL
jgi:hypothetical protein